MGAFWIGAAEDVDGGAGKAKVGVAQGSILCCEVVGHLTPPIAKRLTQLGDDAIASTGRLWIFCDWSQMTGYDSRCRTELTHWATGHGDIVRGVHVFTNVKIVRMGVAVASMFIKRVHSYDDDASFREAYREVARSVREG